MNEDHRVVSREKRVPFLILGDPAKPTHVACLACKKGSLEGSQRGDTAGFLRTHLTESPSCTTNWSKFDALFRPTLPTTTELAPLAVKKHIRKVTPKTSPKTLSMEHWSSLMPELSKFVTDEMDPAVRSNKMTIVYAPVKSGKRKMVECYATYTTPIGVAPVVHFFLSSFVRRADSDQRDELSAYLRGGDVLMINSDKRTGDAVNRIKAKIREGFLVYLHFDELDYGSQFDGLMARIYCEFLNEPNVKYILYSATPEEALAKPLVPAETNYPKKSLAFKPPSSFCGAEWFLNHNLVHDCECPFDAETKIFGAQFLEQLAAYRNEILTTDTKRRIVVVRVSDLRAVKDAESVYPPELCSSADFHVTVSRASSIAEVNDREIKWDSYGWWCKEMDIHVRLKSLWVIFLEAQSTRSTDWFCHPWLRAYFDYHPEGTPVNTRIQSGERVNFYKNKRFGPDNEDVYKGEDHIVDVFASKKVFQYSAGLLKVSELNMSLSSRMIVRKTTQAWAIPRVLTLSPQQFATLEAAVGGANGLAERLTTATSKVYLHYLRRFAEENGEAELLDVFRYKSLKYKRIHKQAEEERYIQGGIVTVAKNFQAEFPSMPGGGSTEQINLDKFCIDIAISDIHFIDAKGDERELEKGWIFVTMPLSEPEIDNGLLDREIEYDNESISTEPSQKNNSHRRKPKDTSMFDKKGKNVIEHV